MTNGTGLEDLNALLEERAQYERWIAQLNAKREQTPPHVFERVRSDYAMRLDSVMEQLRNRAEGLQSSASTLQERVTALTTQETTRRDARAEIELRAMVGEYTAERANQELAVCDAEIGRLESERSTAAAELHRLQEILGSVRQPSGTRPAEAPAHAVAAAPAHAAAAPHAPPPPPPSRPLGAPAAPPEQEADDELAFLNSVMDRAQDSPAPLVSPPTSRTPSAPGAPRIDDIPLVTSLEPSDRAESQPAREGVSLRQATGTPAFLKGMPTEQVKTLKCQECGTMNYPTEWYCERCGGALAAM
jgi:hypothetical protein